MDLNDAVDRLKHTAFKPPLIVVLVGLSNLCGVIDYRQKVVVFLPIGKIRDQGILVARTHRKVRDAIHTSCRHLRAWRNAIVGPENGDVEGPGVTPQDVALDDGVLTVREEPGESQIKRQESPTFQRLDERTAGMGGGCFCFLLSSRTSENSNFRRMPVNRCMGLSYFEGSVE